MTENASIERRQMPAALAWLLWLALVGAVLAGALLAFGVAMWAMEVALSTGRQSEWIGSILLLCASAVALGLIVYSAIMMRRQRRRRAFLVFLPPILLFAVIAFPFLA